MKDWIELSGFVSSTRATGSLQVERDRATPAREQVEARLAIQAVRFEAFNANDFGAEIREECARHRRRAEARNLDRA